MPTPIPRRLILAALLFSLAASAGEINRSWETLARTARRGRKLVVTRMNLATVEGKLLAIDSDGITVQQPSGPQSVPLADVFRVRDAGRRGRNAAIGALIGAAGGAVILVCRKDDNKSEAAGMGAFLGVLVGAIGGSWVSTGATLYQAAEVVRKIP